MVYTPTSLQVRLQKGHVLRYGKSRVMEAGKLFLILEPRVYRKNQNKVCAKDAKKKYPIRDLIPDRVRISFNYVLLSIVDYYNCFCHR